MATTKLKASVISAMVLTGAITSIVIQQHSQAKVRGLDTALQQQKIQLDDEQHENARLSTLAALATQPQVNNKEDLARLRNEVAGLRQRTNGITALRNEANRLKTSLADIRRDPSVQLQATVSTDGTKARSQYAMQLGLAVMEFASENAGEFPTNLLQAFKYFSADVKNAAELTPNQFELVYTGSRAALDTFAHPGELILIRQKEPWRNTDGKWVKAYVFCDGSGTLISVADGNFDAWEKRHTVPSGNP